MPDRKVKVILDASIAGFTAKMSAASKSVSDVADSMTDSSKESTKFRDALDELGDTAGKIGLAAAAGVGAAVIAAANFDASMSQVAAATHASAKTMGELRTAALIAGRDTVFSATESADAITAMSKAGVSAADILHGGLNGALALASAGELDVASAADIAATAMNQFGLKGKDVGHIADVLAATAGKAQGEVTDIANSMKFVGPVAHQMGISLEETAGSIGELASQGILGEQAGTSLRGMLSALTSPSKTAAQQMKNLGISLYDATGKFVGFRGIAQQLHDTMGGLTNAERDQALGRIFGNEQITAARILYAGGAADVDKWTRAVNDQGYAADTARMKMDNLRGDLEQLKGSLETALIGAGSGAQRPLRDITQDATGVVNAFSNLPPAISSTVTSMLAVTAVAGGGLFFGTKMIAGIASTRAALTTFNATMATTNVRLLALTRTAGAVGGALAVAFTLHQLEKDDPTASVKRFNDALTDLGTTGRKSSADVEKLFHASNSGFANITAAHESIDGLVSTFKALNQSDFMKLGDWAHTLFGTWNTRADLATSATKKADAALTQMVQNGQTTEAANAYNDLAGAAGKAGISIDGLTKFFPKYNEAAVKSSGAAEHVQDAMTGLLVPTGKVGEAVGAVGRAAAQSSADLEAQAKALDKARDAAGQTAREFVGLGKSLNDEKVSLGGWLDELEKQNQALHDFMANAKTAAKRGLREGVLQELAAAGPEGAMRLAQLANGSKAEIDRMNKIFKTGEKEVDAFKDQFAGKTQFVIDTEKAERKLKRLRALMDSFYSVSIKVDVATGHPQAAKNRDSRGNDFALGGYTGSGGKYEPAGVVHRGEYVFSSEATKGREGYLDALHRSMSGYATGGMVGAASPAPGAVSLSLSDGEVDRIAGALLAARPLAGDIHISGDPTVYHREMRRLDRQASVAGMRRTR